MVKVTLVAALDYAKGKETEHGRYSYRVNGKWYVCKYGPGYANTYEVTEMDEAGLKLLESKEKKE